MAKHEEDADMVVVERKNGSIGSFLWGALIGAGFMLFYAPRSGAGSRRELRASARRLRDTANTAVRDLQTSMNESVGDVRQEVDERVESARRAYAAGRRAASETRDDLRRRANDTRAAIRSELARRPPGTTDASDTSPSGTGDGTPE